MPAGVNHMGIQVDSAEGSGPVLAQEGRSSRNNQGAADEVGDNVGYAKSPTKYGCR